MSRQIPLCYSTEAAVGSVELALLLRQIHHLADRRGAVIRKDRKWVRLKHTHWREFFPSWKDNTARWFVKRGRALGVLETRRDIEPGMLYAVHYGHLAMRIRAKGDELPKWILDPGVPKTTGLGQLDMLVHHDIEEAVGDVDTERVRVRLSLVSKREKVSFRSERNSHFETRESLTPSPLPPPLPSPPLPESSDPERKEDPFLLLPSPAGAAGVLLTNLPSSDEPNTQLPAGASNEQESQQERFIQSIKKRVDPIRMPDLDTIRGLAEAWEQETGRTIHPAWGEALWGLATQPGVNEPIGFMTDRFKRLVRAGIDLSSPPEPVPPRRENREDRPDKSRSRYYAGRQEEPDDTHPPSARKPDTLRVPSKTRRLWAGVLGDLQGQVTRPSFDTWLKGTEGLSLTDDTLVVGAPNTFVAEMLERRMHALILEAVGRYLRRDVEVRFQVVPEHVRVVNEDGE